MSDLSAIVQLIEAVPLDHGRRVIAVAGAPASGKSTLAEDLRQKIANACVVPMDGFHRDNEDLIQNGLLARKGAPETFDVAGFTEIVRSLRTSERLPFPTFDRTTDSVVPDGGLVAATDHTILVEGNYLLLDAPMWRDLAQEWDYRIFLDVPTDVLQARLVSRWVHHGHSPDQALMRAESNDLPNARLVADNALPADLTIGGC